MHYSEISGLCLKKCPDKTFQNLLYFICKKNYLQHRPGHLFGKNKEVLAQNVKQKKLLLNFFLMFKIWVILKQISFKFH